MSAVKCEYRCGLIGKPQWNVGSSPTGDIGLAAWP